MNFPQKHPDRYPEQSNKRKPPVVRKHDIRERKAWRPLRNLLLVAGEIVAWIPRWYRHKTEAHTLRALTDRHLRDIGLDSFQIASSIEELIELETRSKVKARDHIPYR